MTDKKCYIAGPMTGIPHFNFPLFDKVAMQMRRNGWDIVSPAEMDAGPLREAALSSVDGSPSDLPRDTRWGDVLARDVRVIANDCDRIVLLPGWRTSKGATLEAVVGLLVGVQFYAYDDDGVVEIANSAVNVQLRIGTDHAIDSLGGVGSYGDRA